MQNRINAKKRATGEDQHMSDSWVEEFDDEFRGVEAAINHNAQTD
jgi:hypothetical protein